jgi:NAD(P)-dependent dehydrogenase (short-subunit alcohol dehydrogenase family)
MSVGALELFDLTGKVAVVIGGSRGIGYAIGEGLAAAGASVVIANRQAEQGEAAAAAIRSKGCRAVAIPVDVTRRESVQRLVAEVQTQVGPIEILVNSAAVIVRRPIAEVPDAEWDAMMSVNLRGLFLTCQVVGLEMRARKRGKIINISSNIVQPLQPNRGAYAVTKAGVSQLTRVFALEWAPHGVTVNAIAPAPTITDLNRTFFEEHPEDRRQREQSIPMGRMGMPSDYVGAAIFLASPASDFVTGQTFFVDGGSNLL